jgi:polyisoprenyl-teichoic acid--peptidoglycan teichoic acid transferase
MTDGLPRASAGDRSPVTAAVLSFCWPGLGQLYTGRRGLGLVLALPIVVIAGFFAVQALAGVAVLGSRMFVPAFAWSILALAIVVGVWRLAAIVGAFRSAGTQVARRRPAARAILAVLIVVVVGSHALVGYYSWAFIDASNRIFVGNVGPQPSALPGQSPLPSAAGNGPGFGNGSAVTPPTASSRITVLLTGIDAYRTRTEALNDTLLVVSFDPVAKTADLLSIPRDTSDFKLYFGGVFQGKINSLMSSVYAHPKSSPDSPVDTLTKEVGFLLGIPINFYAAIDLANFEKMIDLVGGVDVNNPKVINDPLYDWLDGSPQGFKLSAGPHHLNGRLALAYVRSRQGLGDNDYTRAARQQEVLISLAKKMASPTELTQLPALLNAAANAIKTDLPADQVPTMVGLASSFDPANIYKAVLGPPYNYHPDSSTTGGVWTSRLIMSKIAALSIKLFGAESTYYKPPVASPSPSPSGP